MYHTDPSLKHGVPSIKTLVHNLSLPALFRLLLKPDQYGHKLRHVVSDTKRGITTCVTKWPHKLRTHRQQNAGEWQKTYTGPIKLDHDFRLKVV